MAAAHWPASPAVFPLHLLVLCDRDCVVPIEVPPLREQREDIQPLVHHLLSHRAACQALALAGRW